MERLCLQPINLAGRGTSRKIFCQVLQSPLAGVSDQIFRNLVRKWAPDALLYSEMVNATSLNMGYGINKVTELAKEKGPVGVQLVDFRPEAMLNAAQQAEASGAFLIDINMGCPVRKVAKKGSGSALLKEPRLAAKIVNTVVNAVKIPVTVKTRLGWSTESCNSVDFSRRIQDSGAQLLTIHGRSREQGFSGKANWEAIREIKAALDIPVIANGDITSVEDAIQCLRITKADGVMIGRASMGAPWLVGQIDMALRFGENIQPPTAKVRIQIALEQLQELLNTKGDHGLLIARKHMNWTCKGFPGASTLRHQLVRAKTPKEAIDLLEKELIKFH